MDAGDEVAVEPQKERPFVGHRGPRGLEKVGRCRVVAESEFGRLGVSFVTETVVSKR